MTTPLQSLLAQRDVQQAKNDELWKQLDEGLRAVRAIDEELFSRMGTLVDAFQHVAGTLPSEDEASEDLPTSLAWNRDSRVHLRLPTWVTPFWHNRRKSKRRTP